MPRDWNERYADPAHHKSEPEPLLVEATALLPPGRALDVACGVGQNALYLAMLGWGVTAVDRSRVAINVLRRAASELKVDAQVADLEAGEFFVEPNRYDLVCDFFYLQRSLLPALRKAVKPGGSFVAAIHLEDPEATRPMNPAFTLRSGELREAFAAWKISYYSEAVEATHSRRAARIIARKA